MSEKDEYGRKTKDGGYTKMTGSKKKSKGTFSFYDRRPDEKEKDSTHVTIDPDTKSGQIIEKDEEGTKTVTDYKCYITTACMVNYQDKFDDNSYELEMLRDFRDRYVSVEDINHYYEVAPLIVDVIMQTPNSRIIFQYLYDNLIVPCVSAIEEKDYDFAYNKYKATTLALEDLFLKQTYYKEVNNYLELIKQ